MSEHELIITADDLGISEGVNRGIVETYEQGILTTCSLLANGLAFEHAVKDTLVQNSDLPVGVHLNLMFGNPLRMSDRALVGPDGLFRGSYVGVLRHFYFGPSKTLRAAVLDEFRAQTEKVAEAIGRPIDHFNTQSHIHSIPALFDLVSTVAQEMGCPHVRVCKEVPMLPFVNKRVGVADSLRAGLLYGLSSGADTSKCQVPDRIMGMNHSGYVLQDAIAQFLQKKPKGLSEICIHPGYALGENERLYAQSWVDDWIADAGRDQEMQALLHWSRSDFQAQFDVALRPFNPKSARP